jgi:predicted lysophospholipase L1 biosynthesis ABC-type transport system permease subunit
MSRFWGNSWHYAARHWSSLAKWWQLQRWPMRFYSGGAIVIAAALLFALIGLTYKNIHQTIFEIGALLLASGILLEGYQQANKLLATSLGSYCRPTSHHDRRPIHGYFICLG